MSDSSNRPPSSPFVSLVPALLVAVIGVYGYYTFRAELTSPRPKASEPRDMPPPAGAEGFDTKFARLWQDPLELPDRPDQSESSEEIFAGSASTPLGSFSMAYKARRSHTDATDRLSAIQNQIEARVRDFTCSGSQGKVLCMPVLVPGEPYVQTREQRRRTRYALLSALADSGFPLKYPQRMSFVKLPPICIQTGPTPQQAREIPELVVPIKLYRQGDTKNNRLTRSDGNGGDNNDGKDTNAETASHGDETYEAVFVLWINESQLGDRPLAALGQVLSHVFTKATDDPCLRKQIDIAIIGPSSSGMLLKLAYENWEVSSQDRFGKGVLDYRNTLCSERYGQVTLYSPRATVSLDALQTNDEDCPCHVLWDFVTSDCQDLKVVRMVGDDVQLMDLLRCELKLRYAWPNGANPKEHIVLVTERDTLYGQAFRTSFTDLLRHTWELRKVITEYTYLRGIDGIYPDSDKLEEAPDADLDDTRQYEVPHGTAQLDYLRRLEEQVRRLDKQLRAQGKSGVTAIGIGGTDIFDKLLILRSLRPRFPSAIFFTTDLDARFAHEDELEFTRNLLVASHFALELNPQPGQAHLPFRDSYQTATYFSTLRAVGNAPVRQTLRKRQACDDPWGLREQATNSCNSPERDRCKAQQTTDQYLEPLMFEIGRTGPYQLTMPSKPAGLSADIHPASLREESLGSQRWRGIFGALLVMGGIAMLWMSIKSDMLPVEPSTADESPSVAGIQAATHWLSPVVPVCAVLAESVMAGIVVYATVPESVSLWLVILLVILFLLVLVWRLVETVEANKKAKREPAEGVVGIFSWAWPKALAWAVFAGLICLKVYPTSSTSSFGSLICLGVHATFLAIVLLWPIVIAIPFLLILVWWLAEMVEATKKAKRELVPGVARMFSWARPTALDRAVLASLVTLGIFMWAITENHYHPNGAPFDFRAGISPWPSVLLCLIWFILGVTFLVLGWKSLHDNRNTLMDDLCGRDRVEASQGDGMWARIRNSSWMDWPDDATQRDSEAWPLCEKYFHFAHWQTRLLRVGVWTGVVFLFAVPLLAFTGGGEMLPFRGGLSWWMAYGLLCIAGFVTLLVIFLTLDAFLLCRRFVSALGKKPRDWRQPHGPRIYDQLQWQRRCNPSGVPWVALNELLTVRFIARHTKALERLLWYPFVVLAAMVVALHPALGSRGIPPVLAVMIVIFVATLFWAVAFLRKKAKQVQSKSLERLNQCLSQAEADTRTPERRSQIRLIIDDVRSQQEGALRPWLPGPLVPFTGVGGIVAFEHLRSLF